MATAETVQIGPSHPPKEDSILAFNKIQVELKTLLQHLRHETNKHEPQYFAAVNNLSDRQLTDFSSDDLLEVRIATTAYGNHLFGKVLIPDSSHGYFMFRAFIPGDGLSAKVHSIHLAEIEKQDGEKEFRAIFSRDDPLEWFDV